MNDMSKTPSAGAQKGGNEGAEAGSPAAPSMKAVHRQAPRGRRRILMVLGPVVAVAAGLYIWVSGGRYVATDNAYVKADKLNIAADVAGFVTSIEVKEGDEVKAGQPLFHLDDKVYRIALQGAEAQLDLARNQVATLRAQYRSGEAQIAQAKSDLAYYRSQNDRQADLAGRGISAQTQLDQARRDFEGAQARLAVAERQLAATLAQLGGDVDGPVDEQPSVRSAQSQVDKARRDLAHTVIAAPFAGVVTNVSALQRGQYLSPAQSALSLVSSETVWIEANPKESDLTFMKEGDATTVTVDSYPGKVIAGHVASISPATGGEFSVLPAQNASGNWVKVVQRITVRVALDLPKDAPRLRSGMSAAVSIDTGHVRHVADLATDLKHLIGG
jgi:membrane fusion protein (multidrug efflux system)